jgi:hypothetical protein
MFPGITDRMQKELTALAPSSVKVCISLRCCFLKAAASDLRSDETCIFHRLRLLPLRNANIPSGLVAPFWLLSVLSRILGALKKSMTRVAPGSFIAVSVL